MSVCVGVHNNIIIIVYVYVKSLCMYVYVCVHTYLYAVYSTQMISTVDV